MDKKYFMFCKNSNKVFFCVDISICALKYGSNFSGRPFAEKSVAFGSVAGHPDEGLTPTLTGCPDQ
jgi:hypothetical protein